MFRTRYSYEYGTSGPCVGAKCNHCATLKQEIKDITTVTGEGKTVHPNDKKQADRLKLVLRVHQQGRKNVLGK
jgi:hypothetical protein